jgi:hypothetical protein
MEDNAPEMAGVFEAALSEDDLEDDSALVATEITSEDMDDLSDLSALGL